MKWRIVPICLVALIATAVVAAARGATSPRPSPAHARTLSQVERVQSIIRFVFGPYGSQAISVARCETGGTFWPVSRNGQYHGIFQMGSGERARYGDSPLAWGQAIAAYKYFVDSGRDWSPWGCKP